jgi:tRNA(Ile)-lysidine synthase
MLYQRFISFNQHNRLFNENDKILLAVSGGIDSMSMMHLFSKVGNTCIVAHCNFQLRGSESDGDEIFVKEQAHKLGFPFFSTTFDTKEYASANKVSIQMAARELRYSWFRELCKINECAVIAVAHNRDDALETFFINLGRGTGIKGLTSIQPHNEGIIRPLLYATRKDIEKYAEAKNIPHREDSSNKSDKYLRNYLRHKIIPSFEEVFPNFRDTIAGNISKLCDISELYDHSMNQLIPKIFRRENKLSYININALLTSPAPKTILFEILSEFGFTPPIITEIYDACFAMSGKQFYSPSYKLIKDREHFILSQLDNTQPGRIYIDENTPSICYPIQIEFSVFDHPENFEIERNKNIAQIDYDKVTFPLILRKWNPGDYFTPLGMKGLKKLSDFFIDQKFSLIDKENAWLLTSGPEIIWIIGHRIDDRFKLTPSTRRIIQFNYTPR